MHCAHSIFVHDVSAFLQSMEPDIDIVFTADNSRRKASRYLLCMLSAKWRTMIQGWKLPTLELEGLTGTQFDQIVDLWLSEKSTPPPVPKAFELLVAMDFAGISPDALFMHLRAYVQDQMTLETCMTICANVSLEAIPTSLSELLLPVLLERDKVIVRNPFIANLVEENQAFADPHGLLFALPVNLPYLVESYQIVWRDHRLVEDDQLRVIDACAYDEGSFLCAYTVFGANGSGRYKFAIVIRTNDHTVVAARSFDAKCGFAMNRRHIFLTDEESVEIFDREGFMARRDPVQVIYAVYPMVFSDPGDYGRFVIASEWTLRVCLFSGTYTVSYSSIKHRQHVWFLMFLMDSLILLSVRSCNTKEFSRLALLEAGVETHSFELSEPLGVDVPAFCVHGGSIYQHLPHKAVIAVLDWRNLQLLRSISVGDKVSYSLVPYGPAKLLMFHDGVGDMFELRALDLRTFQCLQPLAADVPYGSSIRSIVPMHGREVVVVGLNGFVCVFRREGS